ncbi:MAG: hypothetical protein F4X66_16405 [Chloroflexi bacterium]|nr:hypothetical protein [Chloroflexota bacterium]
MAVVGRGLNLLLAFVAAPVSSTGQALSSVAAGAPEDKKQLMMGAIDAVLTGMAYAGVGLCLFAIVWAGFVLMAEGSEGETRRGRARNAVVMAIVGLVVVLLAKAIAVLISGGLSPILPGP